MMKYFLGMIIFFVYSLSIVFIIVSYNANNEASQLFSLIVGILLLLLSALLFPNTNNNSSRNEMELLDDIIRSTNVDYDFEFENNKEITFREDKTSYTSNHPFCPYCGTLFDLDSIFCTNCGIRL